MLTITDTAAEAVKTILARSTEADDAGVRIRDAGGDTGFELSLAPAPAPAASRTTSPSVRWSPRTSAPPPTPGWPGS